jgi:hypothetical protein
VLEEVELHCFQELRTFVANVELQLLQVVELLLLQVVDLLLLQEVKLHCFQEFE